MSLIWADNFQSYGSNETRLTDGIYAAEAGVILASDPDPNATGTVLTIGDLDSIRFALPGGVTASGGVAWRIWYDNLPNGSAETVLTFRDAANAEQVNLAVDSTGIIYARRGSTTLGTSGVPVLTAGAWNHVEVKVRISDTVGTYEVRVNGVTKIALTGQDTKATSEAGYSQVQFQTSLSDYYIKDLVIWDTNGSVNNDFFGSVSVVSCRPTSDVSFNWGPSTGTTGWNLVDESSPNDTAYISADDAPPAASVFGLADVAADITSIRGVVTVGRMRKTDGGDCNIQMSMVSGASEDAGADRPITTAFTYYWDVSELDPATAAAWTPAGFNASNLKINRTL